MLTGAPKRLNAQTRSKDGRRCPDMILLICCGLTMQ